MPRATVPVQQDFYFKTKKCGSNYSGKTGRSWAVRLGEHWRQLEVGHLERSRLAQHSFEENHRLFWEEAEILETEKNPVRRKYKKATYVA
jgi:hypothetical protein